MTSEWMHHELAAACERIEQLNRLVVYLRESNERQLDTANSTIRELNLLLSREQNDKRTNG
jgi:hypothetical protein